MEKIARTWSSGSDEGFVPSPPPQPPSGHRGRPMSSRRRSLSLQMSKPLSIEEGSIHQSPLSTDLPNVSVVRPQSSFNKFRPLPSISSPSPPIDDSPNSITGSLDDLHLSSANRNSYNQSEVDENAISCPQKSKPVKKNDPNNTDASQKSSINYSKGLHPLPVEPSEQEVRLQLAVKLPSSGKRFHRYFSPEDYLQDLHHFAENVGEEDLSDYVLACNAPRKVFANLTQRICDVGLLDKTVLYFEERADA